MAYDYIERIYGRRFRAGQRVTLDEYGGADGTVLRCVGDPMYVRVKWFDGRTGKIRRGDFHPMTLTHDLRDSAAPRGEDGRAQRAPTGG